MKTASLVLLHFLCAIAMSAAYAQQAPKLPANTETLPPPSPLQVPRTGAWPPNQPSPKTGYVAQVPTAAQTDSWWIPESVSTLLAAQTATIKLLSKRIDELEARLQTLEAARKDGPSR